MEESILSALLVDFLAHPVVEIRLSDSEEVVELRKQLEAAKMEMQRAQSRYGLEVSRNLRYEDFIRSIGVNPSTLV